MDTHCAFIAELARILAENPLREKILLAPSHRVGRQWLDRAARLSGGFVNARAVTVRRLVRDYADPVLRRRNLRAASRPETARLVGWALERIADEAGENGYFTALPPSPALVETLGASLEELEAANVVSTTSLSRRVTPPAKAAELVKLIRYHRGSRNRAGLAGPGDIHAAAVKALAETSAAGLPLLLVPAALGDDFSALEWGFVSRWPPENRVPLPEDGERRPAADAFVADGVADEAREVLRRIVAGGMPLDGAEIVCVDSGVYVPALAAAGLETFGGRVEDMPMTFNSGLPGFHSRPGRLLSAWLDWLERGLPAEGLARMIDSGLIPDGWRKAAPAVSPAVLAGYVRSLPINGGPDEYRRGLSREDGNAIGAAGKWLADFFERVVPVAGGAVDISNAPRLLGAADNLLSPPSRHDARLDAYARSGLLDAVRQWRPCCDWPGFDAPAWLGDLAANLRVMGLGPLPGMLHVTDIPNGGHSGRPAVFVVGLDESRFPGSPRQDPVLLDRERAGVSPLLRKSADRTRLREKSLTRLFSRLRGNVTVSHARRDAATGQELHPAAAFAEAARNAPVEEAAIAPAAAEKCLCRRDDWLWLTLGRGTAPPTRRDIGTSFPNLADGFAAGEARASSAFTEYDGDVPEAAAECDPAAGRVFSPTDLELMAACPLDYFFKRVLSIAPPDRYEPAPGRWLEGNRRGTLLHDLFQNFLDRLQREGETLSRASRQRHRDWLHEMLDRATTDYRRRFPPRDLLAYRREIGEMREAADIFFLAEEDRRAEGEPLHREVRLGGEGEAGTPWDRTEPVPVFLEDGRAIRFRGRVDRVDRLRDGGLFIVDYKTGRSAKFAPSRPFNQGRNLQPFLYAAMLEQALDDLGRPEAVRRFAYFFPMPRDEGRVIAYERSSLTADGRTILGRLSRLLAEGRFPFTTDPGDAAYSDYAPIYGDVRALAAASRRKTENDPRLADWRALREMEV